MTGIAELWQYREVLLNLVRRNLKVRYKNSLLGFLWSLLNPLMQIGVWWLVFGVIMRPSGQMGDYMPYLLTGFLPWLFFSQTVLDSTACVTQEMALVKKAYFPRAILPMSTVISNLVHLAFAFVVLVALSMIWGFGLTSWFWSNLWMVLPATLLLVVFAYGIAAMVSAWSVWYADVKFIVGNVLGLWFFLTPVLYPISLVLMKTDAPGRANWLREMLVGALPALKVIYLADPVAIGILGYRSGLLHGGANPLVAYPDYTNAATEAQRSAAESLALLAQGQMQQHFSFPLYVLIVVAVAVVTAVAGQLIFRKLAPSFAEKG